jgi:O-antigen ligase
VKGRWRVIAAIACAGCTVGLLGSEVRSPLIGVVVGVGLVFLLFQLARAIPGLHLGVTATAALAAVLVGVGVFSFTGGSSEGSKNRYTLILTPTRDPAFQARLLRWRTVLVDIDSHPFGQGLGTASRIQRQRARFANNASISIDNSYLQLAFEQGLGVMVLFVVACLLMLWGLARRALATAVRERAAVAIGACGALAAYLAVLPSGPFIEGFNTLAVWMLVGLGVAQFAFPDEPGTSEPAQA